MTAGRRLAPRVVVTFIVALAAGWAAPPDAAAQEPQECGNGTTFTVVLPSIRQGGDGDTITLPAGCRIYTLFVSGYARNPELDELTFYQAGQVRRRKRRLRPLGVVEQRAEAVHWKALCTPATR